MIYITDKRKYNIVRNVKKYRIKHLLFVNNIIYLDCQLFFVLEVSVIKEFLKQV